MLYLLNIEASENKLKNSDLTREEFWHIIDRNFSEHEYEPLTRGWYVDMKEDTLDIRAMSNGLLLVEELPECVEVMKTFCVYEAYKDENGIGNAEDDTSVVKGVRWLVEEMTHCKVIIEKSTNCLKAMRAHYKCFWQEMTDEEREEAFLSRGWLAEELENGEADVDITKLFNPVKYTVEDFWTGETYDMYMPPQRFSYTVEMAKQWSKTQEEQTPAKAKVIPFTPPGRSI